MSNCGFELAFQFPFNVLDRRFEEVAMPVGSRYARSIFLQGLLASINKLRTDAPKELFKLKKDYYELLNDNSLDPLSFAVSFVMYSQYIDYFLVGVDSEKQLIDILQMEYNNKFDLSFLEQLAINFDVKWLDPRNWMVQK